jgi:tetratricopeptide (TPR) repeat protein
LAAALRPYWFNRGHVDEGITWLDAALARGSLAPVPARARALLAQSSLLRQQGDVAHASRIGKAALALFRETNDRLGLAWCLELFANALNDSRAEAEEALSLFHELDSLDGMSRALRALGTAVYLSGDHTQAVRLLEQAIAVAQRVEDWWEVPVCLARLYDVNPKRALELCEQELARGREVGDAAYLVLILKLLGILLLAQGEYERARAVLEESVQWWQRAGMASLFWLSVPVVFLALGVTELSLGHINRAIAWLDQSRMLAREDGITVFSDIAQFLATSAMINQGEPPLATRDTRECLQRFHQYGHRPGVICALVQTAYLARQRGDMQCVTVLLGAVSMFDNEWSVSYIWEMRVMWRWYQNAQQTIVEPALAAARDKLGDDEFNAAYASGQRMTLEQAVESALAC